MHEKTSFLKVDGIFVNTCYYKGKDYGGHTYLLLYGSFITGAWFRLSTILVPSLQLQVHFCGIHLTIPRKVSAKHQSCHHLAHFNYLTVPLLLRLSIAFIFTKSFSDPS